MNPRYLVLIVMFYFAAALDARAQNSFKPFGMVTFLVLGMMASVYLIRRVHAYMETSHAKFESDYQARQDAFIAKHPRLEYALDYATLGLGDRASSEEVREAYWRAYQERGSSLHGNDWFVRVTASYNRIKDL